MQRKLYFKSSVENHKNWVTKVIFSVCLLSVCVSFFVFFILSVLRIQSKQFLNFILSKSSPPFLFSWHQSVEVASPSTVCNRIVVTFALHKHDTNLCENVFQIRNWDNFRKKKSKKLNSKYFFWIWCSTEAKFWLSQNFFFIRKRDDLIQKSLFNLIMSLIKYHYGLSN